MFSEDTPIFSNLTNQETNLWTRKKCQDLWTMKLPKEWFLFKTTQICEFYFFVWLLDDSSKPDPAFPSSQRHLHLAGGLLMSLTWHTPMPLIMFIPLFSSSSWFPADGARHSFLVPEAQASERSLIYLSPFPLHQWFIRGCQFLLLTVSHSPFFLYITPALVNSLITAYPNYCYNSCPWLQSCF